MHTFAQLLFNSPFYDIALQSGLRTNNQLDY